MSKKIRELLGLKNIALSELRTDKTRESWDLTFLREAVLWANRSHDAETQCGCVLVRDKTPLSVGYNGFIRNINDDVLPNVRPHKYPFMIHAEINAILNCARQGKSTIDATAYITTKPCLQCLQFLWQAGINRIVYTNYSICTNKHYESSEADDKIRGMMLLINFASENLTMTFIDKKNVLPN